MKRWKLKTLTAFVLLFAGTAGIWSCGSGSNVKTDSTPSVRTKISAQRGGVDFRNEKTGIEMVFVKGGTFTMGCTREQAGYCDDGDEEPVHSVTVGDFYIGKYEVTQAEWVAVMGENPSRFKGDNLPVENVSWDDVWVFISKLNSATGKTYRLPTEAEWEFAARGGVKSKGFKYAGGNIIDNVAWHDGNSNGKTHPVGTKKANELGIHDMSGNVWEWVSDWYGSYTSTAKTNPSGPSTGSIRVFRGGSWGNIVWYARVSFRRSYYPSNSYYLGFRLAVSP